MKALAVLLAALAGTAAATPAPIQLGGRVLAPASCAVRHTLWIEHYSAELYVPAGMHTAAVKDPAQPKMLRMRILNSLLLPRDIPRKWRDALQPVLDRETMSRLNASYRALQDGDTVVVSYVPEAGLALRVNDRPVADVAGHAAIDALLAAWASDAPVVEKLAGAASRHPCA